mmetsp:Transcript_26767/g.36860  ORF Transcript_26767/g.36860 Transcript_26767/m.36860 type:complete len:258 (-) Transcript_26767:281-1054(-)
MAGISSSRKILRVKLSMPLIFSPSEGLPLRWLTSATKSLSISAAKDTGPTTEGLASSAATGLARMSRSRRSMPSLLSKMSRMLPAARSGLCGGVALCGAATRSCPSAERASSPAPARRPTTLAGDSHSSWGASGQAADTACTAQQSLRCSAGPATTHSWDPSRRDAAWDTGRPSVTPHDPWKAKEPAPSDGDSCQHSRSPSEVPTQRRGSGAAQQKQQARPRRGSTRQLSSPLRMSHTDRTSLPPLRNLCFAANRYG